MVHTARVLRNENYVDKLCSLGATTEDPEDILTTKVNIEFYVDCTTPILITAIWDVAKEDIYQLSPILRSRVSETKKKTKKGYEKVATDIAEDIHNSNLFNSFVSGTLPSHFASKSNAVSMEEGLKQHFSMEESDFVSLSDLIAFLDHRDTFPLVLVIIPDDEECVLICPVEVTWEAGVLTGTPKNQYILTNSEFHELQDVYGIDDDEECVICLTDPKDTTILPCNHFAVCSECFEKIGACPICRSKIEAFVRFYNDPKLETGSDSHKLEAEIEIVGE